MNGETGMELIRLKILHAMIVIAGGLTVIFVIGCAWLIFGNAVALGLVFFCIVVLMVWAWHTISKSKTQELLDLHKTTIQGYVIAHAAAQGGSASGEILRHAVNLAKANSQLDMRAAQMAERMNGNVRRIAAQSEPVTKDADFDNWFGLGNDVDFVEAE